MADQKLPTVQQHAQSVMDQIIAERGDTGLDDAEAVRQAAAVPTFSTGTAALSPKTGKPIVPGKQKDLPTFSEEAVAIPEATGTEKIAPEEAPASKEAILAAHQKLLEGQEPTAAAAVEAEPAPAPAAQAAGAEAAEAAAAAIDDVWAEMDEFTFSDPDLEIDIPIRVPRKYLEPVKRGYGRRAALDREIRYAKEAQPLLQQLISDGSIHNVLPLIQFARDNPEYGQLVTEAFQRAQRGLPLIEQAKIEAATSAIPAPAPDPMAGLEDPYLAEQMRPLRQQIETLEQRLSREDQSRQRALEEQQATQRRNNQVMAETRAAHEDLARSYPQQTRLDLGANDPFFQRAVAQARTASYGEAYGIRAGILFGAQMVMQIEQEKLRATASPTAEALRSAEAQHGALARQEAARAAQKVGGGSVTRPVPPAPPQRPSTMNGDGTMKSPAQYRDEMLHYLEVAQSQPV